MKSDAPLNTREWHREKIIRKHGKFMIIWKKHSNNLPTAGSNKMLFFPSPSSTFAATASNSSLPAHQCKHLTDKYASVTSLSTESSHSLSSVVALSQTLRGRAVLSLWRVSLVLVFNCTSKFSCGCFSLTSDVRKKRLLRADAPLLTISAIL